MGINRAFADSISEYGYGPAAVPSGMTASQTGQWLDPNSAVVPREYVYNPQKAKQLLLHAGYKMGSNGVMMTPQEKPLSLTLDAVSGWTDNDEDAEIFSQELSQIGIQVQVHELAQATYFNDADSGNFQLIFDPFAGAGPTPYYLYDAYLSPAGGADWEGWSSPVTNALLDQFQRTSDLAQQKEIMYKIEGIFAKQLPVLPIYGQPSWDDYVTTRFVGWPSAQDPYASIIQDPAAWAVIMMHLKPVS